MILLVWITLILIVSINNFRYCESALGLGLINYFFFLFIENKINWFLHCSQSNIDNVNNYIRLYLISSFFQKEWITKDIFNLNLTSYCFISVSMRINTYMDSQPIVSWALQCSKLDSLRLKPLALIKLFLLKLDNLKHL